MIPKIAPAFEDIMPEEYLELVRNGPYGRNLRLKDLGTFKELIEEHPLCAGCAPALAIRLVVASLPAPEDTVIVGTTGCSSLLMPQLAIHNIHSIYGNQNAVASGLKRALAMRFPDRCKDVVVIAGDGGTADIGLAMTMHSWFRRERITTVMLDNECYANTGGQESGTSREGAVLNMAPLGKKYPKIPMPELAKESGCAYVAVVSPAYPRRLERVVRRAIFVAREIGPTYVQIFCPCITNYKLSVSEAMKMMKETKPKEYMNHDAKNLIERLGI